jgi:uncharacterized protein
VALAALAALAGCEERPAARQAGAAVSGVDPAVRGRVIDIADVLAPGQERALAAELAASEAEGGPKVVVVTVTPTAGDSLEHLGWAVGGRGPQAGKILLLVDPAARQVRLEGDLGADRKAELARAMAPALQRGDFASALSAGAGQLRQPRP